MSNKVRKMARKTGVVLPIRVPFAGNFALIGAFRVLACLTALLCSLPVRAELDDLRIRATVDATWDDNVTRAEDDDRRHDSFIGLNLNASVPFQMTQRNRVVLGSNLGIEAFDRYRGLDRTYLNFQAEYQFRGSGEFSAPMWGAFVRQGIDRYQSNLRDGYRASAGLSVRKPATDRIFLFGALSYNLRDGRSKVFDTQEFSLRGNIDYALPEKQTAYLGLEVRQGDIVSTARSQLKYLDIADVLIQDDVFTDTTRFSYRIKAVTTVLTLGYNVGLAERASIDFAWRLAYSQPDEQPPANVSAEKVNYLVNQFTAAFLFRF